MKKIVISVFAITILLLSIHFGFSVLYMGLETFSITEINASSQLAEDGKPADYYAPVKAFDNKAETSWCKGKDDTNTFIEAKFKPFYTNSIYILNGYGANKSLYYANNRIKEFEATVTFKDGSTIVKKGKLADNGCLNEFGSDENSNYKCRWSMDPDYDKSHEVLISFEKGKPRCVTGIKLKVISVYPGKKYSDTCIAEIGPFVNAGWRYDFDDYLKKSKECCPDCRVVE